MEQSDKQKIYNAVISQQGCQRNWDLSKTIPEEDIELMLHAATQSPTDKNECDFEIAVVTDRNLIEQIYKNATQNEIDKEKGEPTATNSQVLANVLFCYIRTIDSLRIKRVSGFDKAQRRSVGISSGNLTLVANILGYKTGFCKCLNDWFKDPSIFNKNGLNHYNGVELVVGVGYPNDGVTRNVHHYSGDFRPRATVPKNPGIRVEYY